MKKSNIGKKNLNRFLLHGDKLMIQSLYFIRCGRYNIKARSNENEN